MSLHDFFQVRRLIPENQEIFSISTEATVKEALDVMQRHDFDQLPSVSSSGKLVGVFSYRSLSRHLHHMGNKSPLDAKVDDFLEEAHYASADSDVETVLRNINTQGAVIVLGDAGQPIAIATAADVGLFLWQASQPFLLLQDIELATRALMSRALEESDLDLSNLFETANVPPGKQDLSDLTFGELFGVLTNKENYGKVYCTTFGGQRAATLDYLQPVIRVRNSTFHFREHPSLHDLETLVTTRKWLARKVAART